MLVNIQRCRVVKTTDDLGGLIMYFNSNVEEVRQNLKRFDCLLDSLS